MYQLPKCPYSYFIHIPNFYWSFILRSFFPVSILNSFSVNFTKWSNTLKQFVGNLPTNCLSAFDHFVGLALKGLMKLYKRILQIRSYMCWMNASLNIYDFLSNEVIIVLWGEVRLLLYSYYSYYSNYEKYRNFT